MNPLYLMQQFQQFSQQFQGNPEQQVMQMLQSGQITQEEYNQAVQQAKMLQQFIGIK